MRGARTWILVVAISLIAIGSAAYYVPLLRSGNSTRDKPGRIEEFVASETKFLKGSSLLPKAT